MYRPSPQSGARVSNQKRKEAVSVDTASGVQCTRRLRRKACVAIERSPEGEAIGSSAAARMAPEALAAERSYIMPPMPPMSGIAGASGSGMSTTSASVVRRSAAIDAAF